MKGNSPPYPLDNSTISNTPETAVSGFVSKTDNSMYSYTPAKTSPIEETAVSGYFPAIESTQIGSPSVTGRLPPLVGNSMPSSYHNSSSGVTLGPAASGYTAAEEFSKHLSLPISTNSQTGDAASGFIKATGAVTAPAFSFNTGSSPTATKTDHGNSNSNSSAASITPITYISTSSSVFAIPATTMMNPIDNSRKGTAPGAATTTPDPSIPHVTKSSSSVVSSHTPKPPPSVWNFKNVNCGDFSYKKNGSEQWALVNGDVVVSTFESMLASNALICPDCWGGDNTTCTSSDWRCKYGLRDVSQPNASFPARWDTAAAHFARLGSETDLTCGIMQTECSGAPGCDACNGPGPWAIIKSLETMQNLLENIYKAIIQAGVLCDAQMILFSKVFAPVPSIEDQSLVSTLYAEIFGGLLGVIPVIGAIGGVAAGIGSSVGLSNVFTHAPGPVDTASVLGLMANQTAMTYANFAADLFATGSSTMTSRDSNIKKTIALRDQMKDGALMQQQQDPNGYYTALLPQYQRILFQQLALYTWQNLELPSTKDYEVNGGRSIIFITFDNKPCDQITTKTPGTLWNKWEPSVMNEVKTTYNGLCYYLLKAFPTNDVYDNGQTSGETGKQSCSTMSLPGGTNTDMKNNADEFASLSLADFIIPAVKGWQANGNRNGYSTAAANGVLPTDPQAAASVSIPICDYFNNEKTPGAGCPKLSEKPAGTSCATFPGANQPGTYHPGKCRAHITEYKPKQGDNPLLNYELAITIFDDSNILIGEAIRQSTLEPLVIVDSVLPFDLIVATGTDKDPIDFWYSDQYWSSSSSSCKMGGYDKGSRQGDCGFTCPFPVPGDPPLVSATLAHPITGPMTVAIEGSVTFTNTFITATPTFTAPPSVPTYAHGKCSLHIEQYQKNEPNENETKDYEIDAVVYDAKSKPLSDSGQVPAPNGRAVSVHGLADTVTITTQNVDNDPLIVNYQGATWKSSDKGKCKVSGYANGKRSLDCPLVC